MSSPSLPQFIARSQKSTPTERSAAQSHFIDLCRLLGQPTPTEADPTGESYTFERGVTKSSGGDGFADVWLKGRFAWEYKGKRKSLDAAYRQLQLYRDDLENPKLLVACDFNRFEIHTNFNDTPSRTYRFDLSDLADGSPVMGSTLAPLEMLRAVFTDTDRLRPDRTTSQVTEEVAAHFALLAESMRSYGSTPEEAARFLMKLLFCLFAQDVGYLPNHVFTQLVDRTRTRAADFTTHLRELFRAMSTGGSFLLEGIPYFDGGLFSDDSVIELASDAMDRLSRACRMDWAGVEPAIFGTLFERSLDPDKRSQLGAHYTSRADIMEIVEPVLMAPLREEWRRLQERIAPLMEAGKRKDAQALLEGFSHRLAAVRVLDPACGSGNFLYVALKQLLGLEKEAIAFAAASGLELWSPRVSPSQLHGIEVNPYAHELAQIVIWIGYLQWMRDNAFPVEERPILRPLDTVLQMDAILAHDSAGHPVEPEWPDADVIIGNPPFLGDKRMRGELGDRYVDDLRALYGGRVPGGADLVCYWHERTRALIDAGKMKRAGLLSTNSIRTGANRRVLERIKETGDIFMAWSDRSWILDGAAVRVSMVGFDDGSCKERLLNGHPVATINEDLTATVDVTATLPLQENRGLCFLGMMKAGPFDVDAETACDMLKAPTNPNGRPNADVVKRRLGGQDVTGWSRGGWVIDFGVDMTETDAALFEKPFEYARTHIKPLRDSNRRKRTRERWWIHGEPRPGLRRAIRGLQRCIVTPEVAKHRVFVWMDAEVIPDHKLHVIARDDDYFFGVLHSRVHELWSLAQCSWMGVGNDPSYSSSRTFDTFPFPWPPGKEPSSDHRVEAIASAARDLVELRDRWLNPEGATEPQLRELTLTNLYNKRPTWLTHAHKRLDHAVLDAYGWPHDLSDEEVLSRLLALNLQRASGQCATDATGDEQAKQNTADGLA